MANEVTIFESAKLSVPAHMQDFLNEESNIADRGPRVPSLSYEGKVWQISLNGEKTRMTRRNDDGDEEPLQTLRVIILDYNQRRGRTYYEGAYDPAKAGAPVCWSEDGIAPHASVATPKCTRCESCPMAVRGSKVTEQGKSVAACSQHRMLAVIPANKLDAPPLRMKLAMTSDYDKQSPEHEAQGWFAFSNYRDFLGSKKINHTAAVITKMKFDPNVPFPKVLFSPDRWLEPEEKSVVAKIIKSDSVKSLLGGSYTPAGIDGQKILPAPAETKKSVDVQSVAAVKPITAKKTVVDEVKADVESAKPAKPAAPKASAALPDDMSNLLSAWDDE